MRIIAIIRLILIWTFKIFIITLFIPGTNNERVIYGIGMAICVFLFYKIFVFKRKKRKPLPSKNIQNSENIKELIRLYKDGEISEETFKISMENLESN